jgi:hypothetical protein
VSLEVVRCAENKAVKFLLEAILKDEVFHHSLLKNVIIHLKTNYTVNPL